MCVCVSLTFRAEARAGGELGHVYDLHSKLLACLSVDASPHHTKWTPASGTHTHTHTSEAVFTSDIGYCTHFNSSTFFSSAADRLRSHSQQGNSERVYGYKGMIYHRGNGVIEIHKTNPRRTLGSESKTFHLSGVSISSAS